MAHRMSPKPQMIRNTYYMQTGLSRGGEEGRGICSQYRVFFSGSTEGLRLDASVLKIYDILCTVLQADVLYLCIHFHAYEHVSVSDCPSKYVYSLPSTRIR